MRDAWGQNERGEWPADNFLIRGTRFNEGVLLRRMIEQGADTNTQYIAEIVHGIFGKTSYYS